MHTITAQIDIAASPAKVRAAFLDFASYPTWTQSHFKSVTIVKSSVPSAPPSALQPGDTLKVEFPSTSFTGKVTANTPEEFKWLGSLPGVFSGEHAFKFQPSKSVEGHTTFVQEEVFSGMLSFLVGENRSGGKKTKNGFEEFNRDLKARAEAL